MKKSEILNTKTLNDFKKEYLESWYCSMHKNSLIITKMRVVFRNLEINQSSLLNMTLKDINKKDPYFLLKNLYNSRVLFL